MVMVHFDEHIDDFGIESEIWCRNNSERMQLMSKCLFADGKLGCICPVQAIYAVCSADASLQLHSFAQRYSVTGQLRCIYGSLTYSSRLFAGLLWKNLVS